MSGRLQRAMAAFQAGGYAEAETLCGEVLAGREDELALYLLGTIASLKEDFASAAGYFQRVVSLVPDNADYRHILGLNLSLQGCLDRALDALDVATDLRPLFAEAHAETASVLARRGRASGRYSITVVTPTIGGAGLARAVRSVQAQSYARLDHLVVADGPEAEAAVRKVLPDDPCRPVHLMTLPFNTGGGGFNGHRIYGASVYLTQGRYIAFLDEDNAFEPDHIQMLMDLIEEKGLAWAYSLRSLIDRDGGVIGHDDCESLGRWSTWDNQSVHLIDMNCYAMRRDVAIAAVPLLFRRCRDQEAADVALCGALMAQAPAFDCTGRYSVRYTVESSDISVRSDFFMRGNAVMRQRYGDNFPWSKVSA